MSKEKTLEVLQVSIDALSENDYNPNVVTDDDMVKLRGNIAMFGIRQPIIARKNPDKEGTYVIVDGEHRWSIAKELGLKIVPVVVEELSREEAMLETISMNKFRGENDSMKLGKVLKELRGHFTDSILLERLGYTEEELDSFIELVDFDFNSLSTSEDDLSDFDEKDDTPIQMVNDFVVPVTLHQLDMIETALKVMQRADENFDRPKALYAICDKYLSKASDADYQKVLNRATDLNKA